MCCQTPSTQARPFCLYHCRIKTCHATTCHSSIRPKRARRGSDACVDPADARRRSDNAQQRPPPQGATNSRRPRRRRPFAAATGGVRVEMADGQPVEHGRPPSCFISGLEAGGDSEQAPGRLVDREPIPFLRSRLPPAHWRPLPIHGAVRGAIIGVPTGRARLGRPGRCPGLAWMAGHSCPSLCPCRCHCPRPCPFPGGCGALARRFHCGTG